AQRILMAWYSLPNTSKHCSSKCCSSIFKILSTRQRFSCLAKSIRIVPTPSSVCSQNSGPVKRRHLRIPLPMERRRGSASNGKMRCSLLYVQERNHYCVPAPTTFRCSSLPTFSADTSVHG